MLQQPAVTYKELLGDIGSFRLEYKVKAKNDYDTEQYYNITEYFRLKWTETNIYLLDYRRTMSQIFDATGQSVTSSRVNLGIGEDFQAEYDEDKDGNYIAFVKEQSLWMMDVKNNRITSVFSFKHINNLLILCCTKSCNNQSLCLTTCK